LFEIVAYPGGGPGGRSPFVGLPGGGPGGTAIVMIGVKERLTIDSSGQVDSCDFNYSLHLSECCNGCRGRITYRVRRRHPVPDNASMHDVMWHRWPCLS